MHQTEFCCENIRIYAHAYMHNMVGGEGEYVGVMEPVAVYSQRIIPGVRFWWRADSTSIWLELNRRNATYFIGTSQAAKWFLLLLPPPWSQIAFGLTSEQLERVEREMGTHGLWVKLGLAGGIVEARSRNERNREMVPEPW